MTALVEHLRRSGERIGRGYGGERPLRGYVAALGTYAASCAVLVGVGARTGRRLPDRLDLVDLGLVSVATHKLSRLLAKDAVTSPLRAPFSSFEEAQGEGEVGERARGHGVTHTAGELVTCPFCLDQWVATAFVAGTVLAPRPTRLLTAVFAAVAGADWLHMGYAWVRDQVHG
jgi:hypothetical protein